MREGTRHLSYEQQLRLASELSCVTMAVILAANAWLPSVDAGSRAGLLGSAVGLLAFTGLWYHALPERLFGAGRFTVGTVTVQLLGAALMATTGGVGSLYFPYYLLPILASVFDPRARAAIVTGATATAAYFVVWSTDLMAVGSVEETRDAALVRLTVLVAITALSAVIGRALSTSRGRVQREESRQRALFQALPVAALLADAGGAITSFNPAASALFGDAVRHKDRTVSELMPFVPARPAGGSGESWSGVITDSVGGSVEVDVTLSVLIEDPDPTFAYVVHDVTQHAALQRLREQLLYSVAHELRGPLSVLDNALEILADEYASLDANDFHRLIGSARSTSRRLNSLMEDLLNAGNIQSGRFIVVPRPTSVTELIGEALDVADASTSQRKQHVEVEAPEVSVQADRRYARQVLANLILNASKYSPDGSPIRVTAERADGEVRFTVEDRGPGIPSSQQVGLFERFYRVRRGTDEPGVGLGLAIAKGIVDAHGGRIGVESQVGEGTRVWFTLPSAKEPGS